MTESPVISHGNFTEEKTRYEYAKTVAEFLDTVGYDDGSGLLQ
jgi:hypothetical protein